MIILYVCFELKFIRSRARILENYFLVKTTLEIGKSEAKTMKLKIFIAGIWNTQRKKCK